MYRYILTEAQLLMVDEPLQIRGCAGPSGFQSSPSVRLSIPIECRHAKIGPAKSLEVSLEVSLEISPDPVA